MILIDIIGEIAFVPRSQGSSAQQYLIHLPFFSSFLTVYRVQTARPICLAMCRTAVEWGASSWGIRFAGVNSEDCLYRSRSCTFHLRKQQPADNVQCSTVRIYRGQFTQPGWMKVCWLFLYRTIKIIPSCISVRSHSTSKRLLCLIYWRVNLVQGMPWLRSRRGVRRTSVLISRKHRTSSQDGFFIVCYGHVGVTHISPREPDRPIILVDCIYE